MRRIGGYDWAEATHFESELRNYYTHYLGTVTSHTGVIVTFSAHETVYEELNEDLERMIGSLDVYQRPPGFVAGELDLARDTSSLRP